MSDPRHDEADLPQRTPVDTQAEIRPTDDLYADSGRGSLRADRVDTTAPHARPRNNRWGRIALVAAAVILGLALISALFTGVNGDGADVAATTSADPVVTGTVSDTDAVIVPAD